ncbi:N-formylglutamate amidohydrolase [uncultured Croceicoccus sp.]|uniref:N-formylglutamate amidohydrolase n=1 Tax=uncultured Croceicoccus sp. TaxID=1295329 RepID=UPI00260A009C|nr:N-formylglutamate amidohydrolase [uncultured Croceicoccus sp.]
MQNTTADTPAPDHNAPDNAPWDMIVQSGPLMITAIHAGHTIRKSLRPWLELGEVDRLREEDPLTDFFLSAGDTLFRANRSRFEFDLNRSADMAVTTDPDDTWGLKVWNPDMPQAEKDASLALHAEFYAAIRARIEAMIAEHGRILILDLHSYNHRRDGPDGEPASPADNPDIDIGATTMNKDVYGGLLDGFVKTLRAAPLRGREPHVAVNVRWEDGGNFPETMHAEYGDAACIMTLEFKKVFMDEWGQSADILAMQDLRAGFLAAVENARHHLSQMTPAQ